jgi:dipeptidyl aminopeptidase/acylaminoacyl peptidase
MKSLLMVVLLIVVVSFFVFSGVKNSPAASSSKHTTKSQTDPKGTPTPQLNPLTIQAMRQKSYPGSKITIEHTLPDGENYHQYLTSYQSDGLKIYALLTVPSGDKPKDGWPVIVFNHGYIDPRQYQTFPQVGQYASYYPAFSKSGYIVFKPDYRGNGNSEGQPEGAYYSPAYATDDLNAIASIKQYPDANPNKIGVWGHSMGGNITLRDLVVNPKDIKAAVVWGGVVGSYTELSHWHDPNYHPSAYQLSLRNKYRSNLQKQYGTPESNPTFWNSIDPTAFVADIAAPVQIQTGGADEEVPPSMSENLYNKLKAAGKTTEFYSYPGDNHNISGNVNTALQRSVEFFDKYLK